MDFESEDRLISKLVTLSENQTNAFSPDIFKDKYSLDIVVLRLYVAC